MTTQSLWLNNAAHTQRAPASQARHENLLAFAFAIFSAALLGLTLLPPHPAADPTQVDALEIVAGP